MYVLTPNAAYNVFISVHLYVLLNVPPYGSMMSIFIILLTAEKVFFYLLDFTSQAMSFTDTCMSTNVIEKRQGDSQSQIRTLPVTGNFF